MTWHISQKFTFLALPEVALEKFARLQKSKVVH